MSNENDEEKIPAGEREQYSLKSISEEEVEDLVSGALSQDPAGEVTRKRLLETGGFASEYLSEKPVISYLYKNEKPHYIFTDGTERETRILTENGERVIGTDYYKTFIVVTDQRILIIVGGEDRDEYIGLPHETITCIDFQRNILNVNRIDIGTPQAIYQIKVLVGGKGDMLECIGYLNKRGIEHSNPTEEISFTAETVPVCRECREEITPDAERCPHCGFSPKEKRKSKLWWGGTAALTAIPVTSPIGLALSGRGAKAHSESKKNIWEEDTVPKKNEKVEEPKEQSGLSELSELERLYELKQEGAITEEEFKEMKDKLIE